MGIAEMEGGWPVFDTHSNFFFFFFFCQPLKLPPGSQVKSEHIYPPQRGKRDATERFRIWGNYGSETGWERNNV